MKSKICIYIFTCLICTACSISKNSHKGWNTLIEGKWKLTIRMQVNYPTIKFIHGGAIFNSLEDTIYGFRCWINKRDLILMVRGQETHTKIIKLTKDSLIFGNLLEHKTPQVYIRREE